MRHTQLSRFGFFAVAALIGSLPLAASDPVEVPWNQLCARSGNRNLALTTTGGETVEGPCINITVDEVSIRTPDKRVVKIARNTVARVALHSKTRHPLRTLRRDFRAGLRHGIDRLLSPYALAGIVEVPAILAWGAVSAPFCALGELRDAGREPEEVNVI